MKRILLLAIVLFSGIRYGSATHILGGDITYKWKSDNVYTFYIDLYRDCSECKLSGRGGGSSTKDCGDFNVYLRSSSRRSCSSRELATIQPQFVSFRKILPACSAVRTSCDSNSNANFGAEIHRYSVEIDFDDYAAYASCGFEVYVKLASRSDYLSNVSEQEALFFNFAYIDPVVHHSSPEFSADPDLILSLNAPIRHRLTRTDADWDSLLFKAVAPLRDFGKPLTYRTGYSPDRPMTVYCASDPDCNPVPSNDPPIGYVLNRTSGEFRYTPVQAGEKTVSAYSVEIYSRVSGQIRLVGIVRRDIQQYVFEDFNHAPKISTSSSAADPFRFQVCEGTELCFNVLAEDIPVQLPDGSSSPQDSVRFVYSFDSDSSRIQVQRLNTAPYSSIRFCWRPDSSDAREEPYKLRVRAYDDHCPINAYSERWIEIKVVKKPEVRIESTRMKCGNLEVLAITDQSQQINFYNWQVVDSIGGRTQGDARARDTLLFKKPGNYTVLLTVRNYSGCSENTSQKIAWTGKQISGPELSISGSVQICEGDSLKLHLNEVSGYRTDSVIWWSGTTRLSNSMYLVEPHVSRTRNFNPILLEYYSKSDNLKCRNSLVLPVEVDTLPVIKRATLAGICPDGQQVDLFNFLEPKTGSFTNGTLTLIDGHVIDTDRIPSRYLGSTQCWDYNVSSDRDHCVVEERICVTVHPMPELRMRDITSCSFGGKFLLNNLIVLPFQLRDFQVHWSIEGKQIPIVQEDGRYWVELDSLGSGSHRVICEVVNSFGCSSSDTAWFHLLEQAVIEFTDPGIQCQNADIDLNDLFQVSPSGGGWNSYSHPEFLREGVLSSELCGSDIQLNYTYDRFGCFDTKDVSLSVQCAPDVEFDMRDTLCTSDLVTLTADPGDGVWSGNGVQGDVWNTTGMNGLGSVRYTLVRGACTFNFDLTSEVIPRVSLQLDSIPAFLCEGENLQLTGLELNGGLVELEHMGSKYELNAQTSQIRLDQPDSLSAWVLDLTFITRSADCPTTEQWEIPVSKLARFTLIDSLLNGCEPFSLRPRRAWSTPGVDWNSVDHIWRFGVPADPGSYQTVADPTYTYTGSGTYTLNFETLNEQGCAWISEPHEVVVFDRPEAYFVVDPGSYLSQRNTLASFTNSSICDDSMSFLWDFGTGSGRRSSTQTSPRFVFPKDTGFYRVVLTATSKFGCEDDYERMIHVGPDIQLFVPTAFSPNGLGPETNEVHRVHGRFVQEYEVWILSRWGDIVYYSSDIDAGWDGTFKGEPCQSGVYAYKIRAKSSTGELYDFKGNITLLR